MPRVRGSLDRYKEKRDFTRTAEPEGKVAPRRGGKGGLQFVVQKHAASHLHYDLRLELGGVMRSWAVPRGPSPDPSEKRLAVQVEDHPMAYNDFEGTIPKGEYGGGTVMLWDRGSYTADDLLPGEDPEEFIAAELERGKLAFTFHGERLKGSYALLRTRKLEGGKAQWILLKHRDAEAAEGRDLTAEFDISVVSGRTMDDIAAGRGGERTWRSNRRPRFEPPADTPKQPRIPARVLEALSPMKASAATEPPAGKGWTFEPKYDGIRVVAAAAPGMAVVLLTRNGNDKSQQFPEVTAAIAALAEKVGSVVALDGELVGVRGGEIVRFESLQGRMHLTRRAEIEALAASEPAAFVAFDLLLDGGEPLLAEPWKTRRKRLEARLKGNRADNLLLAESSSDAARVIGDARAGGWEGVIAKRVDAPYQPGKRSRDWLKIKIENEQEFVVGGWSDPSGSRSHFGSLLLGYHDDEGRLQYAGNVGTGFNQATLKQIHGQLERLARKSSPFVNPPPQKGLHWVTPRLVAQVRFNEWTSAGNLRQPVFLGLRDDKDAREVVRERVDPAVAAALEEKPRRALKKRAASVPKKEASATDHPSAVVDRLRQIEKAAGDGLVNMDGSALAVTNLGKPFFQRPKRTKGDVLRYYAEMSPYILPWMRDRPLVLKRFPNGIEEEAFYQQTPGEGIPPSVRIEEVVLEGKTYRRFVGGDLPTLLYTIQLGAISYDPWHGRYREPELADYTVIDLDPGPGVTFGRVVEVARAVRDEMELLHLRGGIKTSGSSGIHIYVPLPPGTPADAAQLLAELVATRVAEKHPGIATVQRMTKNRPKGTVYVDHLQNIPGKTVAGVYAVRAKPGATVSAPIRWDELDDGDLSPKKFSIGNMAARMREVGDLWAEAMAEPVDLGRVLAAARGR